MSKASERAYSDIRSLILSGELPAGAPLREEALAEKCGVSRTPIREALGRLEVEMLIRRTESQRSFVAEWSLEEVADSFELRAVVEGIAARRAAERITPDVLERMRRCDAAIAKVTEGREPDVGVFLDANREFHALIVEAAASPRLAGVLATLVEQPIVWRTAHHYGAEELRRSHREHGELLAAFARRDGQWAQDIMGAHIRRAFHAYADAHRGLSAISNSADRRKSGQSSASRNASR